MEESKSLTKLNGDLECTRLTEAPEISEQILQDYHFSKMFQSCPEVRFPDVVAEVIPRPKQVRIDNFNCLERAQFDDFDWSVNFRDAYES